MNINLNGRQQFILLISGILGFVSLISGIYSIGFYVGFALVILSFLFFFGDYHEKLQIPWKKLLFIFLALAALIVFIIIGGAIIIEYYTNRTRQVSNSTNSLDLTPTPVAEPTTSYLSLITLDDVKAEWNSLVPRLTGSIKNDSTVDLCVSLRVDFSKDAEGKQIFDTRKLNESVPAKGAKQLNLMISDFGYKGQFWTIPTVEKAQSSIICLTPSFL